MAKATIPARVREAITDEAKRETQRIVLREAVRSDSGELMNYDEREYLWSRIVRLRNQLGLV
jgi:hypothetical protein